MTDLSPEQPPAVNPPPPNPPAEKAVKEPASATIAQRPPGFVLTPDRDLFPALRSVLNGLEETDIKSPPQVKAAELTVRLLEEGKQRRSANRAALDTAMEQYREAVEERFRLATMGADGSNDPLLADKLVAAHEAENAALTALETAGTDYKNRISHDTDRSEAVDAAVKKLRARGKTPATTLSGLDDLTDVTKAFDADLTVAKKRVADARESTKESGANLAKAVEGLRHAIDHLQNLVDKHRTLVTAAAAAQDRLDRATASYDADVKRVMKAAKTKQAAVREKRKVDRRLATLTAKAAEAAATAAKAEPSAEILRAMTDVGDSIPDGSPNKAAFNALVTATRTAVVESSYGTIEQRLLANAAALTEPRSKVENVLTVEVGAALEGMGIARLRLTGMFQQRLAVERLANGKFKASWETVGGVTLGVKAGFEADVNTGTGKANARTTSSIGGDRTYDSLAELAAAESGRLMSTVLSSATAGKKANADSEIKVLQDRLRLQVANRANTDVLDEYLKKNNAYAAMNQRRPADRKEQPGTGVRAYDPVPRTGVRTSLQSNAAAVDGSIVFQLGDPLQGGGLAKGVGIGGGVGISRKKTHKVEYKRLSFLDDLDNPVVERLHTHEQSDHLALVLDDENDDKLVIRSQSGPDAVDRLDKLEAQLQQMNDARTELLAMARPVPRDTQRRLDEIDEQRNNLQRILRRSLEALRTEYDTYVELANSIDNGTVDAGPATSILNRLLKARSLGKGKTVEYVRAVSVQFAAVRRLFEASHGVDEDGQSVVPTTDKALLEKFREDLAVPRMRLSTKQLEKVFGKEAVGDTSTVTSTVKSVSFVVAGSGSAVNQTQTSKEQSKAKPVGLGVGVSWVSEVTKRPGVPIPETTHSIVIDGAFTGNAALKGTGTGSLEPDDVFVAGLVGKLLSVRSFGSGTSKLSDQTHLEAELTSVVRWAIMSGAGTLQLDFTVNEGQWRLKTAAAVERRNKSVGIGGSIPTSTPINVALSMAVERNRSKVLSTYHGSNTLGGITDVYRGTVTGPDGKKHTERWASRFTAKSGLLERMVGQLVADDRPGVLTADGRSFTQLLDGIADGTVLKGTDSNRILHVRNTTLDGTVESGGAVGLQNDLISWLLDLNVDTDSDDADEPQVNEAKRFIRLYKQHRAALRSKSGTAKSEAMDAMVGGLSQLVAAKAAKEDSEFDAKFQRRRGYDRKAINRHIAEQLSSKMTDIAVRLAAADDQAGTVTSLSQLRKRATAFYRRQVQANANPSAKLESLNLLRSALALDHAAKSMDDLTMFGDVADTDAALAAIGTKLDKLLDPPRIYLSELIDGELVADANGQLQLTAVVKKGQAHRVSKAMLAGATRRAMAGLNADAGLAAESKELLVVKGPMLEDDSGQLKRWTTKHHSQRAEKEYRAKRRAKAGALRSIGGSSKGRSLAKSSNFSIAKSLKLVMEQQARQQATQRVVANRPPQAVNK